MRLDIGRLIAVIIGFWIAQILIGTFLTAVGLPIGSVSFEIVYNLLLAFVAVLIYYPSEYRRQAFKNPDFYRDVAVFFLIFLLLSLFGF